MCVHKIYGILHMVETSIRFQDTELKKTHTSLQCSKSFKQRNNRQCYCLLRDSIQSYKCNLQQQFCFVWESCKTLFLLARSLITVEFADEQLCSMQQLVPMALSEILRLTMKKTHVHVGINSFRSL